MTIYYIPEHQPNSFYIIKLLNDKYRYEGYRHSIKYCIDSVKLKTKEEIEEFLDNCSIEFLIDNEGYIISLK